MRIPNTGFDTYCLINSLNKYHLVHTVFNTSMFYCVTSTPLLLPHTENIAVEGETDLELRLVVAGQVGLDGGHCDQKKEN